jgi:phosphatidylglycerophosphatase A
VSPLSSQLATFFGIGRIPFASGTFASAAALLLGVLLVPLGWQALAAVAVVAVAVGVWACDRHACALGVCDPSECVLDEVAGQWIGLIPVAFYAHPFDWRPYALSFFLFRLFDVAKLWPLSAAERLPGGWGVMADDVLAGLFTAGLVYAALAAGWV